LNTLEEEMGWNFDLDEFDDRLRLQKFVFLASSYGFEHDYSYGMHLRGPYSPPLAQDYYSDLTSVKPEEEIVSTFDVEQFIDLVENREVRWLEVAATLKAYVHRLDSVNPQADAVNKAVQKTVEEKDETQEYVEQVREDLSSSNIFSD